MQEPVSLREFIQELEALMEGWTAYVHRSTGELYSVSDEDAALVDQELDEADLPKWRQEMLPKIRDVLESGNWLELPTKFDIHEWEIMESFSRSIENPAVREQLLNAIHGPGAFRNFRDTLDRCGVRERWFEFKTQAIERIAADWLDAEGIPYRRDGPASVQ